MITVRNATLRRGAKLVLQGASFTLNPGENAGLVGRNGAGKSSLFALLANRLHADTGDVEMPPRWRLGEVAQQMPETNQGATDFVLDGDQPLVAAMTALAAAEAAHDGHAMAEAHMLIDEAGGFDARARAQAMLLGLGFRGEQLDASVNSFSGGWRMRLQLARALMCPADLLLLDEPTNHLDLDALVWLEAWLLRFTGTLIIISHDREFLDAVTKVTLHVDEGTVTRYGANYSGFEEMRAERISQQQAAFGKQQERIEHLQRFIDRFKAKASKAKQAQSRVKALARMERIAPVLTASDFAFEFREPQNLPNPMLALSDLECGYMAPPVAGYGDTPPVGVEPGLGRPGARLGSTVIVRNVNRTVMAGQRIGILGANGQGKSTLVKTIARALKPIAGTMIEGKGLAIGYFAQQEMDLLTEDDTPLQRMTRLARELNVPGQDAREQGLRNFLGQFNFGGDMVHQTVGTLSGGERARLVLAGIVWQRPNLLLLDEPTNHLDLTTREALSMALNEFEGTVMLVSHDRAMLREVCDEFWLVTRGGVLPFDGDLDDYQKWLLEVSRAAARGQAAPPVPGLAATAASAKPAAAAPPHNASRDNRKAKGQARSKFTDRMRPLRNEISQIDQRLADLASERNVTEAALANASLAPGAIADAGRQLAHVSAEVAMLEERWLELQQQLESVAPATR
ncbi:MAG: ATP-binding cassette domain-containing protein [Burkholderiaceae bacterium]|nr:ATP-binding cassette domain-containing protein [Burkholderiaceae bacterium]